MLKRLVTLAKLDLARRTSNGVAAVVKGWKRRAS